MLYLIHDTQSPVHQKNKKSHKNYQGVNVLGERDQIKIKNKNIFKINVCFII